MGTGQICTKTLLHGGSFCTKVKKIKSKQFEIKKINLEKKVTDRG